MSKIIKETEVPTSNSHWIIVNKKKHSIWKQTYSSFGFAKAEYQLQVKRLPVGISHGFKIEKRGFEVITESASASSPVKDFDDFTQSALDNF